MKRLALILALLMVGGGLLLPVYAIPDPEEATEVEEEEVVSQCPKTLITKQDLCLDCHTSPNFGLKETKPDNGLQYPYGPDMRILNNAAYLTLFGDVDVKMLAHVEKFFDYVRWHDVDKCVIRILSGGGSLFVGWEIAGLFEHYKAEGYIVQTEVHGFAASAAFLIFVAGSDGHRVALSNANLMWHELISFSFFDISSPADKEEEAKELRWLQNNIHDYFVSRGNLTKEEIDENVYKKNWWISGKDAVKFGYADSLVNK